MKEKAVEKFAKIRMDILIDAALRTQLTELLDAHDVSGYTVFPAMGGTGGHGDWSRAGLISDVGQMVLFVCIVGQTRKDSLLEAILERLGDHIGYVTASEVEVLRDLKFP